MRIARHSSSDLVLLASDIFRMVVDLKWVGEKRTVGRNIYLNDRRRAVQLSDESVGVMCMDASAD